MAVDVTRPRVSTTVPPRTLDVRKFAESRASELETLHSIVANRLNNDFRSKRSKRRRTTGYDDRAAKKRHKKRRKIGLGGSQDTEVSNGAKEKVPRHVRRRLELKKNPENGFVASGDGTKRLRTHIWHAKRFTMTKLWGFHLPLGLHGRGMGSRALLKSFRYGVLVHDASYYGAVQLEGPQDALVHLLTTVFVPYQSSQTEDFSVFSGFSFGSAMLHHARAPFSTTVAPVTYMWQSLHELELVTCKNSHNADGNIQHCSTSRKLWVWIHGSAFEEGYNVLKLVCQKQMDETGVSVNCVSLHGKLAKLEVMGSKSLEVLEKILHPVKRDAENPWHLKKCSNMEPDIKTLLKKFSSSAIISLIVSDPRVLSEEKDDLGLGKTFNSKESHVKEDASKNMEILSSSPMKTEENHFMFENSELWGADKGVLPPVEENILCTEKQQQKLAFFCLGNPNSKKQRASTGPLSCRWCPIMLLNHGEHERSVARWSIILPISWVKIFWGCLISRGAHAIGLREKHWVASEAKLPCFPSDFPDCDSYSCYMATKAVASDEKLKLRPHSMRPFPTPIPPPWESIRYSVNIEAIRSKSEGAHSKLPCEIGEREILSQNSPSFEGFVPRTSRILAQFLGKIQGTHLLLFPHSLDFKNYIARFTKDNDSLRERLSGATPLITSGRRLCFLRVVLDACRKGVFEEGAVVCAPHYSDITSCTSSSNKDTGEIQIPESSARSYFEQQPSGKWEHQVPKEAVAKASHRWPIGFVTSGFVRGSKKPSAIAFCEAIFLARLREEQWNQTSVKRRRKEIYVLVRNLRSTAYRLALATIILERQEDDLAFV